MSRAVGGFVVVVLIVAAALWGLTRFVEHEERSTADTAAPSASVPAASQSAAAPEPATAAGGGEAAAPSSQQSQAPTTTATPAPTATAAQTGAASPATGNAAATASSSATPEDGEDRTFDVARIEPSGDAVLAGRTAPDTEVTLYANGTEIATTKSNATGDWVIVLDKPLKPGDYDLSVATGEETSRVESPSRLAVSIPDTPGEKPFIALVTPGNAAEVLQQPDEAGAPPVAIATIAAAGGRITVSGHAPAAADVRIYLDDEPLAPAKAGSDGAWRVDTEVAVAPGSHTVRADAVGPDGTVTARAEVPFEMPEPHVADAAAEPAPTTSTAASATATTAATDAVPAAAAGATAGATAAEDGDPKVITVRRGDHLWSIAQRYLGDGDRFTAIYRANRSQIRNPNLIYPGQQLVLP